MAISFAKIRVGHDYTRQELAKLWGYQSFHAIARGVVTPQADNKVVLFVTKEKQDSAEPYQDEIEGERLYWEGPTDHFAQSRIINSAGGQDEVHLFFRERHHAAFTYYGQLTFVSCEQLSDRPSKFVFTLTDWIHR